MSGTEVANPKTRPKSAIRRAVPIINHLRSIRSTMRTESHDPRGYPRAMGAVYAKVLTTLKPLATRIIGASERAKAIETNGLKELEDQEHDSAPGVDAAKG